MSAALLDPRHRPYEPQGGALELWRAVSKYPEVVLAGAAGTGKSRAALELIWYLANRYAGCRLLIARKTRASLTESGLVSLEALIPEGHPVLDGAQRKLRQCYRLANGSEIVICGLDQPSRILSTAFDAAFVQECSECTLEDWEILSTRLRNGVMPFQVLIGDCNPDAPSHWIKLRANAGKLKLIEGRHEDNPVLFNAKTKQWTESGERYLKRLEELSGPRYWRLRHGKWVGAEGAVYEEYSPELHLVNRRPIPNSYERILSLDWGHVCPAVAQLWAIDGDRRMYLIREIYFTGLLVEDLAKEIKELLKSGPLPSAIVCDHDAEDRATLTRHLGLPTVAAKKSVLPGIEAVKLRLRTAADGKPRLMLFRDALVKRDPALVESKKPTCTAEEVEAYCWDPRSGNGKEQPIKSNDHGLDALRYAVAHVDGLGRKKLVFY
jgi:PBSX family phage terminase large subunit